MSLSQRLLTRAMTPLFPKPVFVFRKPATPDAIPLEHAPVRWNTLRWIFLMFFPVEHCFFRSNIVLWEKILFETANTLFFGFKQCLSRKNIV
jgi:hypothetical protein